MPSKAASTILVCEDDPGLRLLLRLAIEPRGHRVIEAGEGAIAILLARNAEPDLVIVDMRLPDCSGIDVVRRLRSETGLTAMPIVMTSGSMQASDQRTAEEAGVDAFIQKPFDLHALVDEVERLLSESESYRSALPLRRLH